MKINCRTDIGATREINQDSCDCGLILRNAAWSIVCDGMGGANAGDIASKVALETIRTIITEGLRDKMSGERIRALMLKAINRANEAVYNLSQEHSEYRGMGTTCVLTIATDKKLHVAHVGDSRGYLMSKGEMSQITMDHSYVQDLVNIGQITREEARKHPQRNIITRVLGVHPEVEIDYSSYPFAKGDITLSCSDGLSNYFDDELLLEYIDEYNDDGGLLCEKLVRYAFDSGGSDNITVAVIKNC